MLETPASVQNEGRHCGEPQAAVGIHGIVGMVLGIAVGIGPILLFPSSDLELGDT
jgi:hypothetical protein